MEKGNIVIQIDILLSEDQITQEFMDALKRHDLPEKFFYWFPLSIRAWINLCSDVHIEIMSALTLFFKTMLLKLYQCYHLNLLS